MVDENKNRVRISNKFGAEENKDQCEGMEIGIK